MSGNWRPVLRGYLEKGAEVEVGTEGGAEAEKENGEEVEAEVDTEVEAEVAKGGEAGAEIGEEVDLGPEGGGAGAGRGGGKIVVSTDKVRILSSTHYRGKLWGCKMRLDDYRGSVRP